MPKRYLLGLLIGLWCGCLSTTAWANLPSWSPINQLGDKALMRLKQDLPFIYDPLFSDYLTDLKHRLLIPNHLSPAQFRFWLIDNSGINAMALPNGHIIFNSGLWLSAKSEDELAAVLSHELAHVTQAHTVRLFEKAAQWQAGHFAALLAGVLLATQNPNMGQAAIAVSQASHHQHFLNYSRHHEEEADMIGLTFLQQAGFNPMAMHDFFQTLAQHSVFQSEGMAYLRTHPLTQQRLTQSAQKAMQYPAQDNQTSRRFFWAQGLIWSKQFQHPQTAIAYFKSRYQQSLSAHWAYLSALYQAGQWSEMTTPLQSLLEQFPDDLDVIYLSLQLKEHLQTLTHADLNEYLNSPPKHLGLRLLIAQWYLSTDNEEQAVYWLENTAQLYPNEPIILKALAEAYHHNQQEIQAHITQANYWFQMGEWQKSLQMLKRLQKTLPDNSLYQNYVQTALSNTERLLH